MSEVHQVLSLFFKGYEATFCLRQLRMAFHKDPFFVTRDAVQEEKESDLILDKVRLS